MLSITKKKRIYKELQETDSSHPNPLAQNLQSSTSQATP
jgi:hypothetical protein